MFAILARAGLLLSFGSDIEPFRREEEVTPSLPHEYIFQSMLVSYTRNYIPPTDIFEGGYEFMLTLAAYFSDDLTLEACQADWVTAADSYSTKASMLTSARDSWWQGTVVKSQRLVVPVRPLNPGCTQISFQAHYFLRDVNSQVLYGISTRPTPMRFDTCRPTYAPSIFPTNAPTGLPGSHKEAAEADNENETSRTFIIVAAVNVFFIALLAAGFCCRGRPVRDGRFLFCCRKRREPEQDAEEEQDASESHVEGLRKEGEPERLPEQNIEPLDSGNALRAATESQWGATAQGDRTPSFSSMDLGAATWSPGPDPLQRTPEAREEQLVVHIDRRGHRDQFSLLEVPLDEIGRYGEKSEASDEVDKDRGRSSPYGDFVPLAEPNYVPYVKEAGVRRKPLAGFR